MAGRPKIQVKDKKSQQVAVRMTIAMVKHIDDFATELAQSTPGMRFSRGDAIRVIVERWASANKISKTSKPRKSAKK